MSDQEILYEKQGHIALVTFNRPQVLNAFRMTMFNRLLAILAEVREDEQVRVLVLTGQGRAFSAGIDLEEQAQRYEARLDEADAEAGLRAMQDLTRQMRALPKPIIAALNGLAVGVGAELAIASDIRLASEEAYFMFAEVKRALFETNGVMYFLPRLVGLGRALAMMLTGDKISAHDALSSGLVTQVYPANKLHSEALALAERLANHAPLSLRLVKQVAEQSYTLDLEGIMDLEVQGMLACLRSEDYHEGLRSFIEQRSPRYTGR